jgi:hypothetical protein
MTDHIEVLRGMREAGEARYNSSALRALDAAISALAAQGGDGELRRAAGMVVNAAAARNVLAMFQAAERIGKALQSSPPVPVERGEDAVCEMRICEVRHLILRKDRLYRFTVDPNCEKCRETAMAYEPQQHSPKPQPAAHVEEGARVTDAVPANCRARLMQEGKPYARSSCAVCGHFSPRHNECTAALKRAEKGEGNG